MLDFAKIKTPPNDGDVLVEPAADHLAHLAESNHALLDTYDFPVLDQNIRDLRQALRRQLCSTCTGPIILTGHQPDFIHAGVWAKHIVASQLAHAFSGKAVNLVVDSDALHDTVLNVPTATDRGYEIKPVRYAPMVRGLAHESIVKLDPARLQSFQHSVREFLGSKYAQSCMPAYFSAMASASDARDWVDQTVTARRSVEHAFGVEMIEHRVSRVWFSPFLADMLANAPRFRACYNAALTDYRRKNRVRSPNRPIPDLAGDGQRCELPVWVYRTQEPRRRLFVETQGDRVALYADHEPIAQTSSQQLQTWEGARAVLKDAGGYHFRPRALSLTLWARVLVGDLFIHGIGGAKYDRITDDLIRRYYNVTPPAMACVSATVLMNLPHDDANQSTLRAAQATRRDIRFNPQRYIAATPPAEQLIARRAKAITQSTTLRYEARRDHIRRRDIFREIRAINEELNALNTAAAQSSDRNLTDVARRLAENRVAKHRDYFFALLDRKRLERLYDKLASTINIAV